MACLPSDDRLKLLKASPLRSVVISGWRIVLLLICIVVKAANAANSIDNLETEELLESYPGAVAVEKVADTPFVQALDENKEVLGLMVLSNDITRLKGYSGAPLNTLVGIDKNGLYQGIKIIDHSEPIVLIGLPESTLTDFTNSYHQHHINEEVVITTPDHQEETTQGKISVDAISGATVTALILNETILVSARVLGKHLGLYRDQHEVGGNFVADSKPWSWEKMLEEEVFGRLTIKTNDFDPAAEEHTLADIWYALADAPQIGMSLLGKRRYEYYMQKKDSDSHILVVFSQGKLSFKGSGFARGGIFDRFRLSQEGGSATIFRDSDYENMPQPAVEAAPQFSEGGVFIVPENKINPSRSFDFTFLASLHEAGGTYKRQFKSFKSTLSLPESIYKRHEAAVKSNSAYWQQAWHDKRVAFLITLCSLLAFTIFFTLARIGKIGPIKVIKRTQIIFFVFVVVVFGFYLNSQLSIINILAIIQFVQKEIDVTLFYTDPVIFTLWVSVFILVIAFGRGIYCGWLCPFGALTELIYRAARLLGIKSFALPEAIDKKLIYAKYLIFLALLFSFLFISRDWGFVIAEIEPFKYTFTVAPWSQPMLLFIWWIVIIVTSVFMLKPFCRYFCPLGVFFMLGGYYSIFSLPRVTTCQSCSICYRSCDYKAIEKSGAIAAEECTLCLTCWTSLKGYSPCPDFKVHKGFINVADIGHRKISSNI